MIIDAVPLGNTHDMPPWRTAGWSANLDAFRLCGYIDDAKCFSAVIPAIENLNPAHVCGIARPFRIRKNSQPELWVAVELRADALALVQALRERGPAPGTIAGVVENGVLTMVSINTGPFRGFALSGGF